MPRRRVMLVCSPGGHLLELYALKDAWSGCDETWVTYEGPDTLSLLASANVVMAHGPTNRHLKNFLKNIPRALRVLLKARPDVIVSTGAGVAVPFLILGRLMGARVVYIESLARVSDVSLTGKLVLRFTHDFFVQWPTASRSRRARYAGRLL